MEICSDIVMCAVKEETGLFYNNQWIKHLYAL